MPPASDVPLDTAGIISTVLEGVLYGLSLFMGAATVWVLKRNRKWKDVNKAMLVISFFLFAFSTTHLCIDMKRVYQGLVKYRDTYPGGPVAFFSDVSQETFVSKNGVYTAHTALGDGVVIYRCYMVWRKIWIIILPLLLWCSVLATGIGTVYTIGQVTAESGNIFASTTASWITSFYATTLSCNFVATAILAFRLWSVERGVNRSRTARSNIWPVLMIVIDAGVLYSVTLLCALCLFASESHAQYIVLDMVTPIISISFYMVLLRVGLKAQDNVHVSGSNAGMNSDSRAGMQSAGPNASYYRGKALQVHISQLTESQGAVPDKSFSDDMQLETGSHHYPPANRRI
ncbi:hypothetical protein BD626DRAFT_409791 [Schizophyllum amplum]|uniref:Uncharacterized protein n=1 Tax=Schizophyllum amplum TaxID=97359 RepID=A0A550C2Q4_9AGAR|nr:hypothetical protein BD626DRAFT_409791 [Auriculariopsis ampla]